MPVVVNLSGYPGIGKATVGRLVAAGLHARFIPNHVVMAPAFALFNVGSPDWWSLTEIVRCSTVLSAMSICEDTNLVFTGVVVDGQTPDLRHLEQLSILARHGGNSGIFAVTLTADEATRKTRLTDPAREYPKLTDWKVGQLLPYRYDLATDEFYESVGATHLVVNTTRLSAPESAQIILDAVAEWLA
jgi:hypothetical protein